MKNFKKYKNSICIFVLSFLTYTGYSQTVNLNYELVSFTSTQLIYNVKLTNTSGAAMKIAAMNNVLTVTAGVIPTTGTTYTWVEASSYSGLNNPTLGTSTAPTRIRATQTPVIEASTVLLPVGVEVLYGTWTVNTSTPMTFPLNLTPTDSGNPQIQLVNYFNGSTNSNTITLVGGTITLTEPVEVLLAPLPIIYTDFDVTKLNERSAKLNWRTSSEINSDYFGIERSIDGNNWELIGKVKAAGNSITDLSYEFIDNSIPLSRSKDQIFYYRLQMTDLDGSYKHSDIRGVNFGRALLGPISIYPNPSVEKVNVDLSEVDQNAGPVNISVYDMKGSLMIKKQVQGSGIELISVDQLPSDVYNFVITQGEQTHQQKVIKID